MNSICAGESESTFLYHQSYREAQKQRTHIAGMAMGLGMGQELADSVAEHLASAYPDKILEKDYEIVESVASLAIKLSVEKQPVMLVTRNARAYNPSTYDACITYGFSGGGQLDFGSSVWPVIRPKLVAPQTMSCYGDNTATLSYANSFPVSEWGLTLPDHVDAYLFRRSYLGGEEVPPENYDELPLVRQRYFDRHPEVRATYRDQRGDVRVGNAEIEEFISDNPAYAGIIDGCREAYRNTGLNPEIGRTIARQFNLDVTDEQAKKISWV